jgi:hypothetical protein
MNAFIVRNDRRACVRRLHHYRKLTFDRSKQRSAIYDRVEHLDVKAKMKASESSTVAVLTVFPALKVSRPVLAAASVATRFDRSGNSHVRSACDFAWVCSLEAHFLIQHLPLLS